jgi:hypothetical protein
MCQGVGKMKVIQFPGGFGTLLFFLLGDSEYTKVVIMMIIKLSLGASHFGALN